MGSLFLPLPLPSPRKVNFLTGKLPWLLPWLFAKAQKFRSNYFQTTANYLQRSSFAVVSSKLLPNYCGISSSAVVSQ